MRIIMTILFPLLLPFLTLGQVKPPECQNCGEAIQKLRHKKNNLQDNIVGIAPDKFHLKQKADSILKAHVHSARNKKLGAVQEKKDSVLNRYRKLSIDTIEYSTIKDTVHRILSDTLGTTLKDKAGNAKIAEINKHLEEVTIDSTTNFRTVSEKAGKEIEKQAGGLDEIKAFQKQQAQFDRLQPDPAEQKSKLENLIDRDERPEIKKPKLESIPKEKVDQYKGKIQNARQELTQLKKKYSEVASSNDLNTAVKKNSLKGKTIKERLVIGGNFQALSFEPVTLDISPVIGYRINKLFQAGVGVSSRFTFTYTEKLHMARLSEGYKAFLSHDIFINFFAYSEFERQKLTEQLVQNEEKEYHWKNVWHVGVGRNQQLGSRISVQAIILYNLLFDRVDQHYNQRWNMKVGVQFNLKKKNKESQEKGK